MFPWVDSTDLHYHDRCVYMQRKDGNSLRGDESWHLSVFHFVSSDGVKSVLDDSAKPEVSFNDIENLCA